MQKLALFVPKPKICFEIYLNISPKELFDNKNA
jgi:hypothetical protein